MVKTGCSGTWIDGGHHVDMINRFWNDSDMILTWYFNHFRKHKHVKSMSKACQGSWIMSTSCPHHFPQTDIVLSSTCTILPVVLSMAVVMTEFEPIHSGTLTSWLSLCIGNKVRYKYCWKAEVSLPWTWAFQLNTKLAIGYAQVADVQNLSTYCWHFLIVLVVY